MLVIYNFLDQSGFRPKRYNSILKRRYQTSSVHANLYPIMETSYF